MTSTTQLDTWMLTMGITFEPLGASLAHFVFLLKWILPGCKRITAWEVVLEKFIACWDELDDPRTGNAALHDFHEILAIAYGLGAINFSRVRRRKMRPLNRCAVCVH
jgi:hypothetical protein